MTPFVRHRGIVAPLRRTNVDTDQIIPKQFLKRIERTGFGQFLFYDWRYDQNHEPRADFVLNQSPFSEATVLLADANFGCGSSREHAPWALADFGFRTIIAPSFADIFYNNCFQNGLLPVTLPQDTVDQLFARVQSHPGLALTIDLPSQTVSDDQGWSVPFAIDDERKDRMLKGLDAIAETLQWDAAIQAYESKQRPPAVPDAL